MNDMVSDALLQDTGGAQILEPTVVTQWRLTAVKRNKAVGEVFFHGEGKSGEEKLRRYMESEYFQASCVWATLEYRLVKQLPWRQESSFRW